MPAPLPTGDVPLWDCWTTWKPNWNAKSPPNCKPPSNKPWMTTSPSATIVSWLCIATTLPYAHAIATGYGEVHLQIPVFRCGQCRRMAGGMALLGDEMHASGFPKNRDAAISRPAR